MPIYEYRCEKCAGEFEVLTSFAERDRAQVCPACESTRTRVQVSSFASFGAAGEARPLDFAAGANAGARGGGCCGGGCGCGSSN